MFLDYTDATQCFISPHCKFGFGNIVAKEAITYYEKQLLLYPFPKQQILDSSKLKASADDNFKFGKNGGKPSNRVEYTVGKEKLLVTSNFSFSHNVFKRLLLQTRENPGLFGNGLIMFWLGICEPFPCFIILRLPKLEETADDKSKLVQILMEQKTLWETEKKKSSF